MIEARPYEKGDVFLFSPGRFYRSDKKAQHLAELKATDGTSRVVTILFDKMPIAVLGATQINKYTWEIWAVISDEVNKCKLAFARKCRDYIGAGARVLKARRFQAFYCADFTELLSWFTFLGFTYEGRMHKFGEDGEDYLLLARLFNV